MTPERWAFDLTKIIRAVQSDCYPVDVESLARQYSAQRYPNDAITAVKGADIDGFEGMLSPAPPGKSGWGIFYNQGVTEGRKRFTIAHEFGHYLIHRTSEHAEIERQANQFAATLLMPLDQFRQAIDACRQPDWTELASLSDRYGVSLLACCHRWMEYTSSRSCLVTSRDGFVLSARSTTAAYESGVFIKTKDVPPVEIPPGSLTATSLIPGSKHVTEHPPHVWFPESCRECAMTTSTYDMTYTLIHLSNRSNVSLQTEPVEDVFDRFGGN